MILGQRELSRVFQPCGCNKVHLSYYFATYLHLVIGVDDELRSSVCIDETFTLIVEIHMQTILRKAYQVSIINY